MLLTKCLCQLRNLAVRLLFERSFFIPAVIEIMQTLKNCVNIFLNDSSQQRVLLNHIASSWKNLKLLDPSTIKMVINSALTGESNLDRWRKYDDYLATEMPMCSVVLLTSLLQTQPLSKALGPDCVSAEHLHAGESLCFLFSELFNMCIVHRYVLNSCLNTKIVPISKNKNGNISDTSNYRPVAVATVVSKLLEHYISSCISSFLGTTDNQFGFKSGQWT